MNWKILNYLLFVVLCVVSYKLNFTAGEDVFHGLAKSYVFLSHGINLNYVYALMFFSSNPLSMFIYFWIGYPIYLTGLDPYPIFKIIPLITLLITLYIAHKSNHKWTIPALTLSPLIIPFIGSIAHANIIALPFIYLYVMQVNSLYKQGKGNIYYMWLYFAISTLMHLSFLYLTIPHLYITYKIIRKHNIKLNIRKLTTYIFLPTVFFLFSLLSGLGDIDDGITTATLKEVFTTTDILLDKIIMITWTTILIYLIFTLFQKKDNKYILYNYLLSALIWTFFFFPLTTIFGDALSSFESMNLMIITPILFYHIITDDNKNKLLNILPILITGIMVILFIHYGLALSTIKPRETFPFIWVN